MLRHMLEPSGRVHASVASFNNHWGVPLTLSRMPENTDFGIFEIGMNHADEIRPLVRMVRPHVAIITTIAAAHLGNFKDLEEIAAAKAEIMEGLVDDGHVILNRDNEQFDGLEKTATTLGVAHIHSFGSSAKADFRMVEYAGGSEGGVLWAALDGKTLEIPMGAPGRHIAENALAALGAVSLVGANMDAALAALATLQPEKGRGARHRLAIGSGTFVLIDESYNANPASMRAAIALLKDTVLPEGGRRIALLGDMLEMGESTSEIHAGLAGLLVEAGITDIWLAGEEMSHLRDALPDSSRVEYRLMVDELKEFALGAIAAGDVVMIKSSKGTGCGRIVSALLETYPASAGTERAE
jgi:UDP-N-acetylmuramoyl-tripeptide--D-alanyl-D-alanine ligase